MIAVYETSTYNGNNMEPVLHGFNTKEYWERRFGCDLSTLPATVEVKSYYITDVWKDEPVEHDVTFTFTFTI